MGFLMGLQNSKRRIRNHFGIRAVWGARPETAEGLSVRVINMLDRLRDADPIYDNWMWVNKKIQKIDYDTKEEALENLQELAFATIKDNLPAEIETKIARSDNGEPELVSGYQFYVYNSQATPSRSISIYVDAGRRYCSGVVLNNVWMTTNFYADADPTIVAFPAFKDAVLAIAEVFDAPWGLAYSSDIGKLWPEADAHYRLGWISYVGPRFAHLITPPASAIVERQPNGGLLMAATDETFSVSNPAHLAAARDILAAVAPLNALPWPPDAKPADV
jgi:Immunity protein 52